MINVLTDAGNQWINKPLLYFLLNLLPSEINKLSESGYSWSKLNYDDIALSLNVSILLNISAC